MKTENQMLRNGKSANCNEKRSQKIAKTAQDSSLTFVTSGVSWKQRPLRPQNLIPWVHFSETSALFLRGFWRICTDGM